MTDRTGLERGLALLLALLFFQAPAVRSVAKYLEAYPTLPIMLALLAVAAGVYYLLIYRGGGPLGRLLQGWIPALLILLALLAVAVVLYPMADALKASGRGSDQDDCVVLVARNMLQGLAPYANSQSYVGNPCSTGPGVALLYLPLVAVGLYGVGAVLVLAACAWALKAVEGDWFGASTFMVLLASSVVTWELVAVGTDFILIGGGLLLVCLLLERWRASLPVAAIVGLAVLAGVLASGRVVFLYTPLVFALMLWRVSLGKAVLFAIVGLAVALGLTAGAYLMSPETFSPLHIIGKGGAMAGVGGGAGAALLFCVPAGALALWLSWGGRSEHWRAILLLCLGAPMAYIALANFMQVGAVRSEGPNYLLLAYPALAAWIVQVMRRSLAEWRETAAAWQASQFSQAA